MKEFDRLVEIMNRLRNPEGGCPWDCAQTPHTLRPHMIEEVYEVNEAITNNDFQNLKEELGDLLLHIVFQAKMADEKGLFSIIDVLNTVNEKMVRRHPHIFGNTTVKNAQDVEHNWEQIKKKEKRKRKSILEGLPKSMPALIKARRIQSKAATVGFDWDNIEEVFAKVREEIDEFKIEYQQKNHERMTEELGDVFFALVNVARKLNIDPDFALEETTKKFIQRFNYIEDNLQERIFDSSLDEMEHYWKKAKENNHEKARR